MGRKKAEIIERCVSVQVGSALHSKLKAEAATAGIGLKYYIEMVLTGTVKRHG